MNEELVRRWINDLRYGGHEQAMDFLKRGDGYCCLGRALEVIYGEDIWEENVHASKRYGAKVFSLKLLPSYSTMDLEPKEMTLLGISYELTNKLTEMNDAGVPFKEIADYLEAQLEVEVCQLTRDTE